jgi:pimeloyl-ACP methyl ester carboxylesterase
LDYENEAAGTTHVSFIKWTAESNSTSTNATTQDILFNPGGPGSSGISFVEQALPVLQQIVGTAYNIIGFDPRGVNNSGPNLSCFPGGEHGTSRLYGNPTILDVNDAKSYSEVYAKAAAFGEFCTKAHSGPNGTAQYANTVATANDMRHYTELLAKSKGEDPQKSQLWYYGVSYGSALGTTFASLFPDRVGRVIVDGILDVENYYRGKWELPDADKAFRSFFQTCYDAGQNGTCAFWATSPAAIEARYNTVVANLARNPIPVVLETPAIATVSDLKQLIAQAAYDPIILFQIVAQVLAELERRDASTLASFMSLGRRTGECTPGPDAYDNEPRLLIACTDANGRFNLSTYDGWVDYANDFIKQSQFLGESWASYTSVQCHKLNIKPPKSQVFEGSPGANWTSNSLLFISSAVDPVTPLRAAQKLVKPLWRRWVAGTG